LKLVKTITYSPTSPDLTVAVTEGRTSPMTAVGPAARSGRTR
jgi:hypothetical protein